MNGDRKLKPRPTMNLKGCLWALFLSLLFWLSLAYFLAVIL